MVQGSLYILQGSPHTYFELCQTQVKPVEPTAGTFEQGVLGVPLDFQVAVIRVTVTLLIG